MTARGALRARAAALCDGGGEGACLRMSSRSAEREVHIAIRVHTPPWCQRPSRRRAASWSGRAVGSPARGTHTTEADTHSTVVSGRRAAVCARQTVKESVSVCATADWVQRRCTAGRQTEVEVEAEVA